MTQPDTSLRYHEGNTILVNVCPLCETPVFGKGGWKLIPDPDADPRDGIKSAVAHFKCPRKP